MTSLYSFLLWELGLSGKQARQEPLWPGMSWMPESWHQEASICQDSLHINLLICLACL